MPSVTLSPEQKRLLFAVGKGVGLVLWVAFLLLPPLRGWAVKGSEIASYKKKLAETRQGLQQLPRMEQELSQLRQQYELPSVAQTPEQQLPELLEMVAQAAKGSQANLLSVKPMAEISTLEPGSTGYLELPMQIKVSAGYHQIGRFVDILENSKSLVRVQQLRIQADSADMWNHQAILVVQGYLIPASKSDKSR